MCDDVAEQIARASAEQRSGAKTPDSGDDGEFHEEFDKDEPQPTPQTSQQAQEPERRFVDGRWLCVRGEELLEFVENEWKSVPSDLVPQLRAQWDQTPNSAQPLPQQTCEVDGVKMVWNPLAQQWIPDVQVDEDFLANYHMNYGAHTDYDKLSAPETAKPEAPAEPDKKLTKQEKLAKKRELAAEAVKRGKTWLEMSQEFNTKIYVSNLPLDIKDEEFLGSLYSIRRDFVQKCGVLMLDPRTGKPKVKLYRDEDGQLKGDGYACYFKPESLDLALKILDGWNWNGKQVKVEEAKFEMKGEFDPSKKKRRLTAEEKRRWRERQEKAFEWKLEKDRTARKASDFTVVLKNMFTLEEIDENAALIMDLKSDVEEMVAKFGAVRHVTVYDTNPDGVITVTFEEVESADECVRGLNRIVRKGRVISCETWDGKTKYKRKETDAERQRREQAWAKFLGDEEPSSEDESSADEQQEQLESGAD